MEHLPTVADATQTLLDGLRNNAPAIDINLPHGETFQADPDTISTEEGPGISSIVTAEGTLRPVDRPARLILDAAMREVPVTRDNIEFLPAQDAPQPEAA